MFRKVRDEQIRQQKREASRPSNILDRDYFYYRGVEISYTVTIDGSRIDAIGRYDKSEVPWLDRGDFERDAWSYLRKQVEHMLISSGVSYRYLDGFVSSR